MGILSRKAEMQKMARNLNSGTGGASSFQGFRPNPDGVWRHMPSVGKPPRRVIINGNTATVNQRMIVAPILKKRYTNIVAERAKEPNVKIQERNNLNGNNNRTAVQTAPNTESEVPRFGGDIVTPVTLKPASASFEFRDGIRRNMYSQGTSAADPATTDEGPKDVPFYKTQ